MDVKQKLEEIAKGPKPKAVKNPEPLDYSAWITP